MVEGVFVMKKKIITNLCMLQNSIILDVLVGILVNDIRSSDSVALLFFLCEDGGGAIRGFVPPPKDVPGLGLDLLHCLSYFI